jgi:hypothetical protein
VHVERHVLLRPRVDASGIGDCCVLVAHPGVDRLLRLENEVDFLRVEREAMQAKGLAERDEPMLRHVRQTRLVVDGEDVREWLAGGS